MPIAYTVDSYWEENGARIDLSELAPYGLMDGERYLFLQGKDGKMQFAQYAYPSLQADASLGDIEKHLRKVFGNNEIVQGAVAK